VFALSRFDLCPDAAPLPGGPCANVVKVRVEWQEITNACCPDREMPGTLYISFTGTVDLSGCSMLVGQTIPVHYDTEDGYWTSSPVDLGGSFGSCLFHVLCATGTTYQVMVTRISDMTNLSAAFALAEAQLTGSCDPFLFQLCTAVCRMLLFGGNVAHPADTNFCVVVTETPP
jgi:hypothetical protein